MKNKIIVTKRRYGFLRTLLLTALLSVEYFAVIGAGKEIYTSQFLFSYLGYIAFIVLFLGSSHSRGVYLKYETELSLVFKCVALDIIVGFFLSAIPVFDGKNLWLDILMLIFVNVITLVVLSVVMNMISRKLHPKGSRRLYIYADAQADAAQEVSEKADSEKTASEKTDLEKADACCRWISADGSLSELFREIDCYDEIYLKGVERTKKSELLKYCFEHSKIVYMTIEFGDILMKSAGIAKDADTPVYYSTNFGIGGASGMIKRICDVVLSVIGLIVCSPFMALTALAIKIEDGKNIVYRQTRCTKDMKEFTIYKFRSMVADSEKDGEVLATKGDERITKVGNVIRAIKFDEILQLVNVIKGDMSIVGPRPERPGRIADAIRENPEFALRTKVKAGITGYAQVHGYYSTSYRDKLMWDLLYIENYSLLLDMKILVMTAIAIITGEVRKQ